jgi:hypothetical protein
MDAKYLFDTLAREEQPPISVDVNRAVVAGHATRRRHRVAAVAVSALSACLAVTVAWLGFSQPGQRDGVIVAVPAKPPAVPTTSSDPILEKMLKKAVDRMMKEHPPIGRIAFIPEIPIRMWLGKPTPGEKDLAVCTVQPQETGCSAFSPLLAKEFAREQRRSSRARSETEIRGAHPAATKEEVLRLLQMKKRDVGEGIAYGIARDLVHGVTMITQDGRKISGSIARGFGAGLGVWIVKYPFGVTAQTLVFTGANGETLQRIQNNLAGY